MDLTVQFWETGSTTNCIARASDISRKKKQNFAGFSGVNSRKNRPISRDFRGKKVKICGTIGRFHGILAEKSQFSQDFQGQILRKIGRFHGKFRGETSPRNTVKNSPFRWGFLWQISLKSINLASIWPALVNVFFNRDNHLLFQQQFTREMS